MSNNLIEVMYGEELFDNSNAKVHVFAVPDKRYDMFKKEMHIAAAGSKDDIPLHKHQFISRQSAWISEARSDLGNWSKAIYDAPEGMIFKIFAHKHLGHGSRTINVNQFIRIRKEAAFREIKINLTGHAKARYSEAVIKGRFDILTKEQAERAGVFVAPITRNMFEPRDIERIMTFKEVEKEKSSAGIIRERVRNKGGEKEVIQIRRKMRSLDLGDDS